jgi:hypothetical protein
MSEREQKIVTCICCGKEGSHKGRNLRTTCHNRHTRRGTLENFPTRYELRPGREMQMSARPVREKLAEYAELRALGYSNRRACEIVGVCERTGNRYMGHLRAVEKKEKDTEGEQS